MSEDDIFARIAEFKQVLVDLDHIDDELNDVLNSAFNREVGFLGVVPRGGPPNTGMVTLYQVLSNVQRNVSLCIKAVSDAVATLEYDAAADAGDAAANG